MDGETNKKTSNFANNRNSKKDTNTGDFQLSYSDTLGPKNQEGLLSFFGGNVGFEIYVMKKS